MTDINRELAEDAAEEYSDDWFERAQFAIGWESFCDGDMEPDKVHEHLWKGYIAARDAAD